MSRKFGRRDAIRGLGVGAAALGMGLGRTTAFGQTESPPKRVIFFYGGSGSRPDLWRPTGTRTDWTMNDLHQPFAHHRDRISYIGNMHMVSSETDPQPAANAHIGGGTHAMTAAHRLTEDRAGGMSIDQAIVRGLEAADQVTAVPSLEIQTNAGHPHGEGLPVYSGAGEIIPFLWDPVEVYDRLFPDGRPDPGAMDVRPEQRSRVLDFALGRFGRLDDPRLVRSGRTKLEQHAAQLRSIQNRLALGRGREFNIPDRSILDGLPDRYQWDAEPELRGDYWRLDEERNTQLVVAALHADITRVITYYVHDAPGALCPYSGGFYRDGDFGTTGIHDLTHKVNDPDDPLSTHPDATEVIRQQHMRTMETLASLLDQLTEALEPDGTPLIDHTLVVYVSQIADGSHSLRDLPWFTVGGLQGAVNTGLWLDGASVGHGALYRTVGRAMGLDLSEFGVDGTGVIDELLG